MNILVTGATGFVGGQLMSTLSNKKHPAKALLRHENNHFLDSAIVPSIDKHSDFSAALTDCNIVIHCAARVHVMNDTSLNPLEKFREVNTYGTLNLAQQAADSGVKRFIFISSIKVNGESTALGSSFKPDHTFIPTDPYGLSKYEAEIGLKKIADKTGMEIVIIRPPLIYGVGVKANFAAILQLSAKGIPLPFGCLNKNRRSLVFIDNLIDLIITCIEHPKATNQTFLVSDNNDLSTYQMTQLLAQACNKSGWQIPIPVFLFYLAGKITGKTSIVQRLCSSLVLDISKTKELLNWHPPYSVQQGFAKTAQPFLNK
ncbi:MAG: SDR family oxidoreductase [Colwellia sp.]